MLITGMGDLKQTLKMMTMPIRLGFHDVVTKEIFKEIPLL